MICELCNKDKKTGFSFNNNFVCDSCYKEYSECKHCGHQQKLRCPVKIWRCAVCQKNNRY